MYSINFNMDKVIARIGSSYSSPMLSSAPPNAIKYRVYCYAEC